MRVIVSAPARADIADIYSYLKKEAGPRMARAIVADIYERCSGLKRMPERYAFLPGFETIGYRKRVFRNYLIIYQIGQARIEVIRVVHGASDYSKLLNADS